MDVGSKVSLQNWWQKVNHCQGGPEATSNGAALPNGELGKHNLVTAVKRAYNEYPYQSESNY